MKNKPYLVGISGGSASGKTSFLKALKEQFSEKQLCIVSQDNYYKLAYEHKKDENGHINFDLPDCVDLDAFAEDLSKLHHGESIQRHEYRFQHENQQGPLLTFEPAPIIVCEGLFIFYYERIFNQFDLKIFINAEEELALQRRIKRDVAERNISEDFVLYQWKNHVLPSYRQFLLPFMAQADLIINNNTHFNNSLKVISDYLNNFSKLSI
ncbi:MAG: uridine kinase [Flavobacteriaceae bacterium]|nr:uridine kinase [Flavobacteriaceae bacterium]MCF8425728.1 uridine kinase [Bacteroidia bacterium]MCF8446400.1 uridine kinase [Bacteroidia bacterium]